MLSPLAVRWCLLPRAAQSGDQLGFVSTGRSSPSSSCEHCEFAVLQTRRMHGCVVGRTRRDADAADLSHRPVRSLPFVAMLHLARPYASVTSTRSCPPAPAAADELPSPRRTVGDRVRWPRAPSASLVPGTLSPWREVPAHIARPEYVGKPAPKRRRGSVVQTPETIEKMRIAGPAGGAGHSARRRALQAGRDHRRDRRGRRTSSCATTAPTRRRWATRASRSRAAPRSTRSSATASPTRP